MFDFLARLFRSEPSGAKAKERLRLVLLSDHLALAPDVVESLKTDLLEVLSRYVEVDTEHVDVTFEQREHEVAMLANVPILSMKPEYDRPRPAAVAAPPLVAQNGAVATEPPPAATMEAPAPDEPLATEVAQAETEAQGQAAEQQAAQTPDIPAASEAIALPMATAAGLPAKLPRSKRRRRRKSAVNGTTGQQANTGVASQTPP